MILFLIYVLIFVAAFFAVKTVASRNSNSDYGPLKTVTFGDESAVKPSRSASVISILSIFLLWAMFTGSVLLPNFLHVPGPFEGVGTFEYTTQAGSKLDTATVTVLVHPISSPEEAPPVNPLPAVTAVMSPVQVV